MKVHEMSVNVRVTKGIKNKELTATIISKIHNIGYYKLIGIGKAFTPWVNDRTLETAVIALFCNELGPLFRPGYFWY